MKIDDVTKLVQFDEKLLNYFSFKDENNHVLMFVDTIEFECVKTFWDLEPTKLDHVEQGKHVEVWVAKTFDEFQKFKRFPFIKSIGEL